MPLGPTAIGELSRLLDEAMDLGPADAESWMAGLAAEHEQLVPRLRRMLALDASRSTRDLLGRGPRLPDLGARDEAVAQAGERVGPYRLIRELGRGGMGSVWLAERVDGSLKRDVALKLPRLASDAGLAQRMARERDIGALLEHPNIARLYDAGVDESGRPYLALEYVRGEPLDTWCEAQQLDVRARLRLFLQVARAVAYAHGRLVVHRDLKPANVLVTADGQTHLLDFGIAKLMHEAAEGDEALTQELGRAMTPHYASPEQLLDEPITVASDVYSLGVLLHKVLTGALPFGDKPLAALIQAVSTEEPEPANRQVRDKLAAKQLSGDLDAILAKALRRQAQQRFATADALADDIERHLRGDPVLARAGGVRYRLAKTFRRHWVGFAATAAVTLALVVGMGLTLLQVQRVNAEAERTRVVKEFVVDLFKVNQRDSAANSELRQLPAEALLEHGAGLIEKKFAGQLPLQAELYGVVAGIFADMSSAKLAADYGEKRIAALTALQVGPQERGQAIVQLADALAKQERADEAQVQARRALAMVGEQGLVAAHARLTLARLAFAKADYAEAHQQLDEADKETSSSPGKALVEQSESAWLRAECLTRQSHFDKAAPKYEAAIALGDAANRPHSRRVAEMRLVYAEHLSYRSRWDEAERHEASALRALRAVGGEDDIDAALAEARLAVVMGGAPQISLAEAAVKVEKARAGVSGRRNLPASIRAQFDMYLGMARMFMGGIEEGHELLLRAAPVLEAASSDDKVQVFLANGLAVTNFYLGNYEEAARWQMQRIRAIERTNGLSGMGASWEHLFLVGVFRQQKRFEEAEAVIEKWGVPVPAVGEDPKRQSRRLAYVTMLRGRIKLERGDPAGAIQQLGKIRQPELFEAAAEFLSLEGETLCALGQRKAGMAALDSYLSRAANQVDEFDPDLARVHAIFGLCALEAGDRSRARTLAALSRRAFEHQPRLGAYWKAPSERLDRALAASGWR